MFMFPNNFTNRSQEIIQISAQLASGNGQGQVEPPHLILAMLQDEEGVVASILRKMNVSLTQIHAEMEKLADSVIFVGRLAEYKYYNMDQIVSVALHTFENKVC